MVTSIGGVPFGSILYIDGVSINNIVSYMGTTITPPLPDYLYVGGGFTTYGQPVYTRILRTDLSGSVDTSFNMGSTGANNSVLCMVTQSDGKIIIGGTFTAYSGSSSQYIARINTDGTRDTTFNVGTGFNNIVYDLKLQSDGKIVAVGPFTTYSGSTRNRIARLNTNGTYDTTYNIGVGLNQQGLAVAIQGDDKAIVVGSSMTSYSGSLIGTGSVRINTDGTRDITFNNGTGFTVGTLVGYAVDIQSDGKIIIGHGATQYSGSTVTRLMRLNTNGTLDTSFNPGVINNSVYAVKIQPDQKILVAGPFNSVSGSVQTNLVRMLSNGNRDTSYNVGGGLNSTTVNAINGLSLDSTGNVYIGNNFTTYSGSTVNRFVKTSPSGTIDLTFNTGSIGFNNQSTRGFNGGVWTTLVSGSKLYLGGTFTTYNAPVYNRIIKLNNTGSIDTTFNMGAGFNNPVYCMATQSDAKLVVGGDFTSYSGSNVTRITRLNVSGTFDTSFNVGAGPNGAVYDFKIQSDGKIVAVGPFTTYSGSSSSGIVRINTNGTRDTTFNVGTGFTGTPNAVTMQSDGKFIIVGSMTNYSGSGITRIVRINTDGTRDLTYNSGTGLSNSAYSIAIQSDDEIIVGGDFITYSGSSVNRLVKINTDGTRDLSFSPGTTQNGGIYTLKLLNNNSLLVAGVFTSYSGSTANRLVKINSNGSRDNSFVVGTGPSGWGSLSVGAISLDKNNKPYIASNFTTYNGSTVNYVAKLNDLGSLDTTLNTGTVTFNGTGNGFNTLPYTILNIIT
jgi:uncharacterized delta-60 repeat protein